jgi:hypothetical protein
MKTKRGRKRKAGARYDNGALTHAARRDDVMSAAIWARQRLYGATPEQAKQRETGSAIGRALIHKAISQTQFDALESYDEARSSYSTALAYKKSRSASDFSGVAGYDGREGTDDEYVRWCERMIARYRTIRHAILTCGDPEAHMAVQAWVDEDTEMWKVIGPLRIAANAIARVT